MPHHDFVISESWRPAFAALGIRSPEDLLAQARCVRDLPDRANLRLRVDDETIVHLKYSKPPRRGSVVNRERSGLAHAAEAGVPVPELVCAATHARLGAVTGTADLGPARPLDACLDDGLLDATARRRTRDALARATAALHDEGRHHRDLYLNHVFVDPARVSPLVAIIDWDRSGRHRRAFGRFVVKDLAALDASARDGDVSEGERLRFLVRYLRTRGRADRVEVRRLARRIRRRSRRIRAHVPRTPVGAAARPAIRRGQR